MGYNLYITRRKNHFDAEGPSISVQEWRELVANDPELRFENDGDVTMAYWDGECEYPEPWFSYDEKYGCIDTKNPDDAIIDKMLKMASLLQAKVQGDDMEVYHSPAQTYFEEQDDCIAPDSQERPAAWWRRLLGWA